MADSNNNNKEEAAEFVATVRGEHVPMKQWWYSEGESSAAELQALKAKYGPYPDLWKEALNWPGWKEARKLYLKSQQQQGSSNSNGGGGVPRKRKSRWGSSGDNNNNDGGEGEKRGRSRWGSTSSSSNGGAPPGALPPPPARGGASSGGMPSLTLPGLVPIQSLPPHKQEEMRMLQSQLRDVNAKLENSDREAARVDALPRGHRDRSPSPPPVYDAQGRRKNTRAVRWRQRYSQQRQDILEKLMALNPSTRGRSQAQHLLVRKRQRKIPIPIDKHPNYNFIGLIIGPRGKTQKQLEAKTGCKIAIRGRGSVKEGARGRRDGKVLEGDNEPLHVVISGDDPNALEAAAEMIEQMLIVIDDEKNVHKQQQLRELALLNGTLKQDEFCGICAEKGHRSFECPKRFGAAAGGGKSGPKVKCAHCGDTSHPTRDCTYARRPPVEGGGVAIPGVGGVPVKNAQELDSDYKSFMDELDGKKQKTEKAQSDPRNSAGADNNNISNTAGIVPQPPNLPFAGAGGNLPPPPPVNLPPPPPPPPVGLPPPPPPGALPGGLPPPPFPPGGGLLPPPPAMGGLPPPPPPPAAGAAGYYGNQPLLQQQLPPQQQQQPPPAPVQPGAEAEAWDPSSYYGGAGAGAGAGAGGFNWWEK